MIYWKFMDFRSPSGNNQIAKWYADLDPREQADFDTLIKILGNSEKWDSKDCASISGKKYQGLSELRFKQCDKQHRVIGFANKDTHEYMLLIGCFHKDKVYKPPGALDQAVKRRNQVNSGEASICDHEEIPEIEE